MVLNHVAHLARFIKVAPATFNAHFFRDGDLYAVDHAVVPVIRKQGVSKTQRQQVKHRFFAQIVVNTVNL